MSRPGLESLSQRVFVSSMAVSQEDRIAVFQWMDGTADVAETSYTPFQSAPDAAPRCGSSSGG